MVAEAVGTIRNGQVPGTTIEGRVEGGHSPQLPNDPTWKTKSMSWSYEHNPTLGVVEVVYKSEVSARDLRESTSELIELGKREGLNRFLVDAADMTLAPSTSLVDAYDLPTRQYVEQGADRQCRVAIYLPDSARARDAVRFYETACVNRGWMVKVFSERQEAVKWLAQGGAGGQSTSHEGNVGSRRGQARPTWRSHCHSP
jgi:hypothetical protein